MTIGIITKIKNNEFNRNEIIYEIDNGKLIIEVYKQVHDLKNKNSLMNIWHRAGFIKKKLPTTIFIDTYYYDKDGNCWGRYNITHTREHKLNFDYILEYTPKNIEKLVNECIRLYTRN